MKNRHIAKMNPIGREEFKRDAAVFTTNTKDGAKTLQGLGYNVCAVTLQSYKISSVMDLSFEFWLYPSLYTNSFCYATSGHDIDP